MEFRIDHVTQVTPKLILISRIIQDKLAGGPVVVELRRLSRSLAMNAKFHAMIGDIKKTVDIGRDYDFDALKALLVDQFEQEMLGAGSPLRHPGKMVISLDGERVVTIRPSTKKFSSDEGSLFIEFLYSWGLEHDARFTDKSLAIYDKMLLETLNKE